MQASLERRQLMGNDSTDLFTAGAIAKKLEISDGKVKKAIKELGIEPAAKQGACCYYSSDAVDKIRASQG